MIFDTLCVICSDEATHFIKTHRGFDTTLYVNASSCDKHKQEVKLMLSKQLAIMS